jgi:SAM-dependent methyltransferase
MQRALESGGVGSRVRILAIPCGIPRDLLELVRVFRSSDSSWLDRLEYHGMDIDSEVLVEASAVIAECGLASVHLHRGDALSAGDYPQGPFDLVVSTGLGEFLQRDELVRFYRHVHGLLRPGGVFFTSATARDSSSDRLLQMVELVTQYRSADDLLPLLEDLPWHELRVIRDPTGLQTFVTATR